MYQLCWPSCHPYLRSDKGWEYRTLRRRLDVNWGFDCLLIFEMVLCNRRLCVELTALVSTTTATRNSYAPKYEVRVRDCGKHKWLRDTYKATHETGDYKQRRSLYKSIPLVTHKGSHIFISTPKWKMEHPYQCIAACFRESLKIQDILLAASGHRLFTYDLNNGRVISIWPNDSSSKVLIRAKCEQPSSLI